MNIKTLTILILTFLLIIVTAFIIGITSLLNNKSVEASTITINEPKIVTENGYKVIKDNDPDRQTVIATVISKTNDGEFYTAVNNYDSNDTIVIDGNYAKGDKVMITFFHYDIESVKIIERNKL